MTEPRKADGTRNEKLSVLVTGITSSVGRHLAHRLYHDRRIGYLVGTAFEDEPAVFRDWDRKRFRYVKTNILKHREVVNLFRSSSFKRAKVRAVIHLAFIPRPSTRHETAHRVNVDGTRRLLDQCQASPTVRQFMFKSSDVVYRRGPQEPVFLDENAELNFDPHADPWVRDRVDADMICRTAMDSTKLNVAVLRLPPVIGTSPGVRMNAFFDSELQFRELGFNPLINLIHISDVIRAFEAALFRNVKGVFNIPGGDTAPLSTLAEVVHLPLVPVPGPLLGPINWLLRKTGKTSYYYPVDRESMRYSGLMDGAKAQRVLGYAPRSFLKR